MGIGRKILRRLRLMLSEHTLRKGMQRLNKDVTTSPYVLDRDFTNLFNKFEHATQVSWMGSLQSYQAATYVARYGIPGAIVECGVWRGGQAAIIASTLALNGVTDKQIYLFDTFEGMTAPSDVDARMTGNKQTAAQIFDERLREEGSWNRSPLREVEETMRSTPYPFDMFEFVEGSVMDTIPAKAPRQIALLRLDTDFYDSTKHEMEHLFDALVPGGVFICDDYWYWEGAKKAVDEYIESNNVTILLQRTSHYHGVMAVKSGAP